MESCRGCPSTSSCCPSLCCRQSVQNTAVGVSHTRKRARGWFGHMGARSAQSPSAPRVMRHFRSPGADRHTPAKVHRSMSHTDCKNLLGTEPISHLPTTPPIFTKKLSTTQLRRGCRQLCSSECSSNGVGSETTSRQTIAKKKDLSLPQDRRGG